MSNGFHWICNEKISVIFTKTKAETYVPSSRNQIFCCCCCIKRRQYFTYPILVNIKAEVSRHTLTKVALAIAPWHTEWNLPRHIKSALNSLFSQCIFFFPFWLHKNLHIHLSRTGQFYSISRRKNLSLSPKIDHKFHILWFQILSVEPR